MYERLGKSMRSHGKRWISAIAKHEQVVVMSNDTFLHVLGFNYFQFKSFMMHAIKAVYMPESHQSNHVYTRTKRDGETEVSGEEVKVYEKAVDIVVEKAKKRVQKI